MRSHILPQRDEGGGLLQERVGGDHLLRLHCTQRLVPREHLPELAKRTGSNPFAQNSRPLLSFEQGIAREFSSVRLITGRTLVAHESCSSCSEASLTPIHSAFVFSQNVNRGTQNGSGRTGSVSRRSEPPEILFQSALTWLLDRRLAVQGPPFCRWRRFRGDREFYAIPPAWQFGFDARRLSANRRRSKHKS